ncbi:MAG: Nif3-like dinuclear metal center hexameric protein [Bacteroidetes bacterium]|nr:Nif3-like dinuclear metal center hexameric protein [Bacteroidota bacterium]
MKIAELTNYLESLAPLGSQESYDNCGLLTGSKNTQITNALITLDCTEAVLDEAIQKNCNLVIAHHPVIFKGLKKLTGRTYVERTIIKAIQHNIAIYALHTNLDNFQFGVNKKIGDLLGIRNPAILQPAENKLVKLSVFVPADHTEQVMNALFEAGAGHIGNYSDCSFSASGTGTFKASEGANPFVGKKGERHLEPEQKLEVLVSAHRIHETLQALKRVHPYEEIAYDLVPLLNTNRYEGAGMIGELDAPVSETEFLTRLKKTFKTGAIRHTNLRNQTVKKVAWCGGSGSFLLSKAISAGADFYITGDFKYHEFFDADNQLVIADIGHFESEQFTIELIGALLQEKFPTFAPCLAETNTNPVNYF